MSQVFMSYSHVDVDFASRLEDSLREMNIDVFRDQKVINWGADVRAEVHTALQNCAAVLVIVSPASLKSDWVPYEIGYGIALRKKILPFLTHRSLELPAYLSRLSHKVDVEEVRTFFAEQFKVPVNPKSAAETLQVTVSSLADNNADLLTGRWIGAAHQQRGPDGQPIDFAVDMTLCAGDHKIEGTMLVEMPRNGQHYTVTFHISGGFVGGRFAWVNYVARDSIRPHFGTILFDMANHAESLVGEYTGYGALTDGIVSGFARVHKVS